MCRLRYFEAKDHIVLLEVLLPRHLDLLKLSKIGLSWPIARLQETGSLLHGSGSFTNLIGISTIYVRLLLIFQTVLWVWEENPCRWLRLTERHRLEQSYFFTVRLVDWAWYFPILLHEHFCNNVSRWVLIVSTFDVVRWVLHSHQFSLLCCVDLPSMRAAKWMRTAPCSRFWFLISVIIVTAMFQAISIRDCSTSISC